MAPASFVPVPNTVCVMDSSGPVGSNLVRRLLERGYTVHAAVQSQEQEEVIAKRLKGKSRNYGLIDEDNNLKIFRCDLFDYHSIVDAMRGCSGLFYTFEPPPEQLSYDEDMVDVEVRAAHNVLEACAQVDTIDKVIFTSSATSVVWTGNRQSSDEEEEDDDDGDHLQQLDERDWSNIDFCRKYKLWHALSKTLAEKSAWALAMDRGINMVTINPGLLISPNLNITNPYLKGAAEMYEDGVLVAVDIKFLIDAHVCVFEDVSTYGRYLCFNHVIHTTEDAMKLAKMIAPNINLPHSNDSNSKMCFQRGEKMIQQRISNNKLNQSMVEFQSRSHQSYDI